MDKRKSWKIRIEFLILCAVAVAGVLLLARPQRELIHVSDVTSVRTEGMSVSYHAAMELLRSINAYGGHRCTVGKNYPAKDYEDIIEIFCEDGVRYELHYWYTSGFSFLHGREDPYASILTRFAADGTAETAWRMVYDFDASYRDWEKQHLSH